MSKFLLICAIGFAFVASPVPTASAQTRILRIVTYNIEADFTNAVYPTWSSVGPPLPGLVAPPSATNNFQAGGVLEGIGEEMVNGNAQAIDILALQETTGNSVTVAPICSAMNFFYGASGMYSNSAYQATEQFGDPTFGDGPNAIIFNTKTLQLLSSVPVDPPGGTGKLGSSSGEYREVMRYQFALAGVATNGSNIFYVYVSHYKSGSSSSFSITNSRAGEASIVRSNMIALPDGARIIYAGDFNTGAAGEPVYGILTAPGTNQLIDPLNPTRSLLTNWDNSLAPQDLTESATFLQYRDDYQMMTTNVYFAISGGLKLIPGTYHVFGNNGSTPYQGTVNSGANMSLNNNLVTNGPAFISASQLYLDLTNASDHLPVVADYAIPIPAPRFSGVSISGTNLAVSVSGAVTGGVYVVLMSTNLARPLANWTALATNPANAGNFTFTATNTVDQNVPDQFYILQER